MKKKSFKQQYFTLMFWLWVIPQSIMLTSFDSLYGGQIEIFNSICDYLVLILAAFYIVIYQKYTVSDIIKIISISLVVVTSAISCKNFSLVSLFIIVTAAGDLQIEDLLKKYFHFGIMFLIAVSVLSIIGIIPDEIIIRNNDIRHSLGFRHPNILGMQVTQFVIIYLYLHRQYKTFRRTFLSFGAILFLILIPNSRTAYILIFMVYILFLMLEITERRKINTQPYFIVLIILSIFFNVSSIYFCITNGKAFLQDLLGLPEEQIINALARFSGGYAAYERYGVSLFGTEVILDVQEPWGIRHIWLDNAYLTLLIRYGIMVYLIFSIGYYCLMMQKKDTDKYLFIILFVYSIYGIMEPSMFRFVYNGFLLFFKDVLFKRNKKKIKQKPIVI